MTVGGRSVPRFTLYGSPHSLPTYKVALILRLSDEFFSFRYLSFQEGMHKTAEFLAISRWGQVPVPVDNGRVHLQSAAIAEHLAETLGQFRGSLCAAELTIADPFLLRRCCLRRGLRVCPEALDECR